MPNEYSITLGTAPSQPSLEVAGDLVVKLHVPYSSDKVTIAINPNITDYQEKQDKPSVQVRQVMVTTGSMKTLAFDFFKNKIQNFEMGDKNYEIELIDIGKINQEGQSFPTFSFLVREK